MLALILALLVAVAHLGRFVAREEHDLGDALVGVDLRGQWRGVGNLERHVPFPLGLEWRDIRDDAATRIRALAHGEREHVARNAEVLDAPGERKRVRWDDADVTLELH